MNLLSQHLLSLLVALPLAAAAVAMTFPKGDARGVVGFGALAMALCAGLAALACGRFDVADPSLQLMESSAWIPAWGATWSLGVDGLSLLLVLVTVALTPLSLWAGLAEIKTHRRAYVACLLALESMVLGALVAVDMLAFYIFWEAMLVPAFMLIGIFGRAGRVKASLQFFLYTMAGSMVMLAALIWAATCAPGGGPPSFMVTDIAARWAAVPVSYTELALFLAFALAFAIKVPLWPLHGWMADAYAEAPVAVTMMLSGLLVKVGAYGFLRYALLMFPRSATFMLPTLAGLAVLGILYAACVALAQDNLRRLLAYASMSHMGFIVLGLCSMAPDALMGSALQMVNHAVSSAGLFMLVGMVMARARSDAWPQLGGLATRAPMLATAFVVLALSSMGLPGLGGFVGEFMILLGTFAGDGLAVSVSVGGVAQGSIVALVALGSVAMALALRALLRRDTATPSAPITALGALVVLGLGAALVLPPVGPLPAGLLLRPLLPHALSALPCTTFLPLLAALATLGVLLGAIYLLVAIERTFFGAPTTATPGAAVMDLTAQERWLLLPFVLATVILGVYPAPVLRLVEPTLVRYAQQFRGAAQWPPLAGAVPPPAPAAPRARDLPRLVPVGPGHLQAPAPRPAESIDRPQRPAP